jgi:hypothetical protein
MCTLRVQTTVAWSPSAAIASGLRTPVPEGLKAAQELPKGLPTSLVVVTEGSRLVAGEDGKAAVSVGEQRGMRQVRDEGLDWDLIAALIIRPPRSPTAASDLSVLVESFPDGRHEVVGQGPEPPPPIEQGLPLGAGRSRSPLKGGPRSLVFRRIIDPRHTAGLCSASYVRKIAAPTGSGAAGTIVAGVEHP